MRRRLELLLFLIAGIVYTVLLVRFALYHPELVSDETRILQGISAEALSGTTPGRQALVGSVWWGPLPMVLHLSTTYLLGLLPTAALWLPPVPLAMVLSALLVGFGCFSLLRSHFVTDGLGQKGAARPAVMLLALAGFLPSTLLLAISGQASALILPLALLMLLSGAAWLDAGRVRHLVPCAFAMAALLFCGFEAWGWVFCGSLLLLFGALRRRDLRRRLPAILLLGLLPAVYVFGVWALLNWLILDESGFFIRLFSTLPAPSFPPLRGWLPGSLPERMAFAICVAGLLRGPLVRDWRQSAFALAGLLASLWLTCLSSLGLGWSGDANRTLLGICALLVVLRSIIWWSHRYPVRSFVLQTLALLLLLPVALQHFLQTAQTADLQQENPAALLRQIREYAAENTQHHRIFVCGYEGLGLLGGDRRAERFVPVMDLHLDSLLESYRGQTLFLLVRKPEGRAQMESIAWQVPDLYRLGSSRTLLSKDFGKWRLFEIVSTVP